MSSIDEIRAHLAATNEQATAVLGLLAQATQELDTIRGQIAQAAQGSNHPAIAEAGGLYGTGLEQLSQLQPLVSAAQDATATYLHNL
ncbi:MULTISPECIES: hypothetical protein [Prauserella salsuginis group]|uniref:WXG100 family type VII secretion target n=1 Tax=Prauserella salsuginis TaxID=387889 RepID=A0ABW6G2A6_9PSEU|nr:MULTISPECIES: hypothetical protein [Prauserella salsuginis group]MCR3719920.1 hypothetical protein [Prauserella flava]MCR3736536.1 hypothetical protein [Prauserella salsuginis]